MELLFYVHTCTLLLEELLKGLSQETGLAFDDMYGMYG
jgi:hypothetical protein